METLSLFKELEKPIVALKAAIAADVDAAGGAKVVAAALWPDEDIEKSHPRLLNACNPKQKQELGYHDIQRVKLLARLKSGASHIHAHESKALNVNLHWVTVQEEVQQVAVNLSTALRDVAVVVTQAQDLMKRLSEVQK
jgi:hypothetical protein